MWFNNLLERHFEVLVAYMTYKVSDGRRKEHDRQVYILVFQKEKGQVQVPAFDSSDTSRFKLEGKTGLREEQKC